MSLFCKEIEEAHFNSRAANLKAEISPDTHACLLGHEKIGMVEIENDLGRMRHPLLGDTRTQSSWMLFVPTPLFGICCWPVVICILLCWATSEISNFRLDRWWVPNPLWIGRLLTICFSSKGEGTGLVCSRMAAHGLPSLSIGGHRIMPSPREQPHEAPARCTSWMSWL